MQFKNQIKKSNTMKLIELQTGKPLDELLREDYTGQRMTIRQMAEKYDVSPVTVQKWLHLYDVPRRHMTFM